MRNKVRQLVRLHDQDYGFTEKGQIFVNVQRIWEETENVIKFIDEFSKTYAHELLHQELYPIKKKFALGEEKTIRKILNEKWSKQLEKLYANEAKSRTGRN